MLLEQHPLTLQVLQLSASSFGDIIHELKYRGILQFDPLCELI